MGYKTILTVVDNVANTQKLGEFVVSLADQFSSHVIGLHMETLAAVPLVAPMEIPDPATVQALQDVAHKETTDVGTLFERTLSANGISHEWRSFITSVGYASASAIDSARCADLIVARQSSSSALSDSRSDIDGFLYESGRPVLLVPHVLTVAKPIKRVLIAWNGSREATRATFDALPFLIAAESVEIFSVDQAESETQSSGLTKDDCATERTVWMVPLWSAILRSVLSAVSLISSSLPCGKERLRNDAVVLRCAASALPFSERSSPLMRA